MVSTQANLKKRVKKQKNCGRRIVSGSWKRDRNNNRKKKPKNLREEPILKNRNRKRSKRKVTNKRRKTIKRKKKRSDEKTPSEKRTSIRFHRLSFQFIETKAYFKLRSTNSRRTREWLSSFSGQAKRTTTSEEFRGTPQWNRWEAEAQTWGAQTFVLSRLLCSYAYEYDYAAILCVR